MSGAPAGQWMVRVAGRIGVTLALLSALSVAPLWIVDQATFVTTTDARGRAHMVTASADAAGRLVEVLARLDDRRASL
ncbi:MAG: hypothetical protein K9G83_05225 [Hyphomonadaceae bacterium]|nr:hypothetical protein [Hyphomonadaceae bacterium]